MKSLFFKSLGAKNLTIVFTSFVVLSTIAGIIMYEDSEKTVSIMLNDQKTIVRTHAETIDDLLKELDVSLRPKDYLYPNADSKVKDHLKVVWKQAKQVTIVKNNERKTVWTTAGTVYELLKEQKINWNEHDEISPSPETAIKNKMEISIKKAFHLTYVDGGKEQSVWSTSTTVADFLTQQGVILNEFDRVEPSLTEPIKENGVVNVIRVEKVTDVVEEPVGFAVVTKKDDSLAKGTEKTLSEGRQGLVSKQYEVILENGKEAARKLLSEEVIRPKQDKVVAVGTKEIDHQVSSDSESTGKSLYVTATAYSENCSDCTGITATGLNLRANPSLKVIAVDPSIIPLGTKVYVDGYGYAIAADTGGAIKGYRIDLFMPSETDCDLWGRKKVKVTILQ